MEPTKECLVCKYYRPANLTVIQAVLITLPAILATIALSQYFHSTTSAYMLGLAGGSWVTIAMIAVKQEMRNRET